EVGQEAASSASDHRRLAVDEADDRGSVDPVDDADPAVALVEPEDRCGGDLECIGEDGADHAAVTDDGDDLIRMAVADCPSRGPRSRAEIGVALATGEADTRRFVHPGREQLR